MGQGALNYQGVKGGIKLNDVIEEFKYVYQGKTIKAGDFVNYINGASGETTTATRTETSVDTALCTTQNNTGLSLGAIKLDDTRVFVVQQDKATINKGLCARVVTIDGAEIIPNTLTLLSDEENINTYLVSIELLPNGNIFIAHGGSKDSYSYVLHGTVCSVSGTTITRGSTIQLGASSTCQAYGLSTEVLSNGNVFIAHSYDSSNRYLYGMVCTINGTTITTGTDTQLNTSVYSGNSISTTTLQNGDIAIAHSRIKSSYYLCVTNCSVSGTTITVNTYTVSNDSYAGSYVSATTLANGNLFVAHSYGSNYYLYGCVYTVSGHTFTKGTDTLLKNANKEGNYNIRTLTLPSGKVFVTHNLGNYNLYACICTISGTSITAGTSVELIPSGIYTNMYVEPVLLSNGNIFIAHCLTNNYHLYAQIFGVDETNNIPTTQVTVTETVPVYEQQVTLATQPPFDGIALSNGVGGTSTAHNEQVKMARPKPINLVVNGDFSNGITGWTIQNTQSTLSVTDGVMKIVSNGSDGNGNYAQIKMETPIEAIAEHKYYCRCEVKADSSIANRVYVQSYNATTDVVKDGAFHTYSLISTYISGYQPFMVLINAPTKNDTLYLDNVEIYDLTATFGAGNEPTKEWCDANL